MSAYRKLQKECEEKLQVTEIEKCILYFGDTQKYDINYVSPERAAEEYAALNERIAKQEEQINVLCETVAEYENERRGLK